MVQQYVIDLLCLWIGNIFFEFDLNLSLYNYGMDLFLGLIFKMQFEFLFYFFFEVCFGRIIYKIMLY